LTNPNSTDETPSRRDSGAPPEVRVEFFGIARQLAGCESTFVAASTLAEVIAALVARFPELGTRCFCDRGLRDQWLFNMGGHFVRDTTSPVTAGATILLMSADAGG